MDHAAPMGKLAAQARGSQRCRLARGRSHAVPGEGRVDAEIMLIREAPGFHEDRQGRPFVGASGNLLEQLLAGIGLTREQVYIANVIKCRPPGNRDPLPDEQDACRPYLDRQIEIVKPRVIATLGRFSMGRFFRGQSIGRIHGQPRRVDGVMVVPMYHPAAALHQASLRRTIQDDFKKLPDILKQAQSAEAKTREPEPTQIQLL